MARREGNQLTASEVIQVQRINSGTYFVENETPSGTIDGVNAVFTLANTPNPSTSLLLMVGGAQQKAGISSDFTLSGATITFNATAIPSQGSTILASYRVAG